MTRIFIGVAWPYANADIHIGGVAGVYLPADAFARYHRLRGHEVLMVSGSDVHGTPVLVSAEKEGTTAQAISERYAGRNAAALARLGVSFDLFTDTHSVVHERTVHELFLGLLENGYISRRTEENPYCPKHARFLPDRYVEGECPFCQSPTARGDECDRCGRILEPKQLKSPRCRLCQTPAEFRPSEHFYLLLDRLAPKLQAYLADKTYWRSNVLGVTNTFLAAGLRPTSITRDLDWGVPLPLDGYASKRFYVWFEAVIGYLSASREWAIRAGRPDAWRKFWSPEEQVRSYYFLGKDNIFFHTVVWPSILLGSGSFQVPYDVPANEWLLVQGSKVSKSRPDDLSLLLTDLLERFPPDVVRLYAALLAPQNHDTEFSWEEFHQVTEDVLSNQYGNLVQRLLVLARDRCGGKIPAPPPGWTADRSVGVGARIQRAHEAIGREFDLVHLKEALDLALTEVREENRRVHEAKPWSAEPTERDRTLYEGLWLVKAAATWLAPFLPHSSAEVFRQLGYSTSVSAGEWDSALQPPTPGQPLGEVRPLFPRREKEPATHPSAAPPSVAVPALPVDPGKVPFDIRAGVVRAVTNHPSADKLYVLKVDVGEPEPRTVVAGVRPFYSAAELEGRRVVLLANLEPRTIRKVTSQGMVLAADPGDRAVLLAPPSDAAPGTPLAGSPPGARTITYEEFSATPIVVGRTAAGPAPGSQVEVDGRSVSVPGAWSPDTEVIVRLASATADHGELLASPTGGTVHVSSTVPVGTRVR